MKLSSSMYELYDMALKGYNNAYAPYSKFKVGSAVLLKNGEIIIGANIENASYGLCNCAERSALFTAYSKGYRKCDIISMLIVGNTLNPISPCGACRQVICELMEANCDIILTNIKKDVKIIKVKDLLPYSFSEDDLNE